MTDPPLCLPLNITAFCSDSLDTDNETIDFLWIYVREAIWDDGLGEETQDLLRSKTLLSRFLKYGIRHKIGERDISILAIIDV